jgi:hypothetical protein
MISLPPFVTLVDVDGFAVPAGEKDISDVPPPDESDPADWPAWTDNWFWEPTEPEASGDAAELAAAALQDPPSLAAPGDGSSWSEHFASPLATGRTLALPPIAGGSPDADPGRPDGDMRDFEDWLGQADRGRPAVRSADGSIAAPDPMDFPRPKDAADRRADIVAIAEFYRANRGA